MVILLPRTIYRALSLSTRLGTLASNALHKAGALYSYVVPRDFAVVCDTLAAQDMLQAANAECPEAASIIEEGLRATQDWESRRPTR
jgi:hypothetical protein